MARILLFDLETTPIKTYTWTLWPTSISHNSIVEDWSIICGAWKWVGEDKVQAAAIKTVGDDKELVQKLRDAVAEADMIVYHNGDAFDMKKLNARLIYHGLKPLPQIHTVDTMKEARKVAGFTCNRLDYLAKTLTGEGKIHVDYQLWLDVMAGSKKALRTMVEYNKVDVEVLEKVYMYLRPYMKSHPHVGAHEGKSRFTSCPKCGSENIKRNGTRYSRAGVAKQKCQCQKCYTHFDVNK